MSLLITSYCECDSCYQHSLSFVVDHYIKHLQQWSVHDPAKLLLTSTFSYLLFPNLTQQTKIATANGWESTNRNPRGPIKPL